MLNIVWMALGLVILVLGAEWLVRGASRLAASLGVPALIIGLTVVAMGTSFPELIVSAGASLTDRGEIALGNVVGSNIFNVLFILGVSAVIVPLTVARQLVRLDVPIMIAVTLLAWALAANGTLTRLEGAALLLAMAAYTWLQVRLASRTETTPAPPAPAPSPEPPVPNTATPAPASPDEFETAFGQPPAAAHQPPPPRWKQALLIALGLALLVVGGRWFVDGASGLARSLGMSELLIGLTIVAAGTSLPEVATSIVATLRNQRDIAVGNVVGSNIFNILGVLGVAALLQPLAVPAQSLHLDIPLMAAVSLACLPVFFTGGIISRREGALFLAVFAAYLAYLIAAALDSPRAAPFGWAAAAIAAPLIAATLAALSYLAWRRGRHPHRPHP